MCCIFKTRYLLSLYFYGHTLKNDKITIPYVNFRCYDRIDLQQLSHAYLSKVNLFYNAYKNKL